ncbi:hypothetical protein D0B54_18510 [Solimonas sp. K1W22B-7]|uniref:hypothetical protein n=1 Tax=Solimonas sp. K1W22B-7 TaxID=2303331 RepID=UPI000E33683B|nr:hypothetical protein [Solimonas sp. K1W22B-7]AXQ30552.1 hypothetical protein D0B54_18510 [Solimonas sp. K1W22B-7]
MTETGARHPPPQDGGPDHRAALLLLVQLLACAPVMLAVGAMWLTALVECARNLEKLPDHPELPLLLELTGPGLLALLGCYGLLRAILSQGRVVHRALLALGIIGALPVLPVLGFMLLANPATPQPPVAMLLWCSLASCVIVALRCLRAARRQRTPTN